MYYRDHHKQHTDDKCKDFNEKNKKSDNDFCEDYCDNEKIEGINYFTNQMDYCPWLNCCPMIHGSQSFPHQRSYYCPDGGNNEFICDPYDDSYDDDLDMDDLCRSPGHPGRPGRPGGPGRPGRPYYYNHPYYHYHPYYNLPFWLWWFY